MVLLAILLYSDDCPQKTAADASRCANTGKHRTAYSLISGSDEAPPGALTLTADTGRERGMGRVEGDHPVLIGPVPGNRDPLTGLPQIGVRVLPGPRGRFERFHSLSPLSSAGFAR